MYATVPEIYPMLGYCSSSSSSLSSSPPSSHFNTPEPENAISRPEKTIRAPAPKKQYQCTECLKYFSRPSALQTHSYTHTAEKPFQCSKPGCGRKFSVVSNLRRHFKVHQKPAVSNKLSSEDRLRYVQQLIKTSEIILARQKQTEQNQSLLVGRSQYNENHEKSNETCLVHLPQPPSSSYRYQHYFLVPKISNIICVESTTENNSNNYLADSAVQLPSTWNNVEQNIGAPPKPQFNNYYSSPLFDNGRRDSAVYGYNMNSDNNHRI